MIIKKKRYFTSPFDIISTFFELLAIYIKTLFTKKKDKVAGSFSEKIMLAVTGVNECAFCSYYHSKKALEKGVSDLEVRDILSGDFASLNEEEAIALAYAQHWTENFRKPSVVARKRMIDYYGLKKTKHIEKYMLTVYFGNFAGNFVETRKTNPPKNNKFKDFVTYLMCAPIAFFVARGMPKKN